MADKLSANASGSCKNPKASDNSASDRKCQAISMETKVATIEKLDSGEKMANVVRVYGMNWLTIETIYKGRDRIMNFFINYHLILHLLCLIFLSLPYTYMYI